MKAWQCYQCNKPTRGKRRWCLLWGPRLWNPALKQVRLAVCAACKKECGAYV